MGFTEFSDHVANISDLSDEPNEMDGLSANELKAKFDKAGLDIQTYLNDTLISELESANAATYIGAKDLNGNASTVQQQLTYMESKANVKSFPLSGLSGIVAIAQAQQIFDYFNAGNFPIVKYDNKTYIYYGDYRQESPSYITFAALDVIPVTPDVPIGTQSIKRNFLQFVLTGDTVQSVSLIGNFMPPYLSANTNSATPYTPLYASSPTTKKYVDDTVATKYEKPSSGIPETDLASAVTEKLNKEETFVAEYNVTTIAQLISAMESNKRIFLAEEDDDSAIFYTLVYTEQDGTSISFIFYCFIDGAIETAQASGTNGGATTWSKSSSLVIFNPDGGAIGNVLKKTANGVEWGVDSNGTWGSITGTLSNQTDLQTALDAKGTYTKPNDGIPETDLASEVKNKLPCIVRYGDNILDPGAMFTQARTAWQSRIPIFADIEKSLTVTTECMNCLLPLSNVTTTSSQQQIPTATEFLFRRTESISSNCVRQYVYKLTSTGWTVSQTDVDITSKITNPSGGSVGNVLKKTASGVEWGEGGSSSGDMQKSVYDPANGNKQVAFDDEVMKNENPTFNGTIAQESSDADGELAAAFGFSDAVGDYSFSQGAVTEAIGAASHSEGIWTAALGEAEHVEGILNIFDYGAESYSASKNYAVGDYCISPDKKLCRCTTAATAEAWNADHWDDDVEGEWLHVVGNGTMEGLNVEQSNAYTLDRNGNGWFSGDVYVGSTSGKNKDAGSKKLIADPGSGSIGNVLKKTASGVEWGASGGGLPEVSGSGKALVSVNGEWAQQSGYGYETTYQQVVASGTLGDWSPVGSTGIYADIGLTDGVGTMIAGRLYTISWGGTEYAVQYADDTLGKHFGNLSLLGLGADTGEPFLCSYDNTGGTYHASWFANSNASVDVVITGAATTVQQIDSKYIPHDSTKQDTISDLSTIRTNSQLATTAIQNPSGGIVGSVLSKGSGGVEWKTLNNPAWGEITGTLSNQADLQAEFSGKQNKLVVSGNRPLTILNGGLWYKRLTVGKGDLISMTLGNSTIISGTNNLYRVLNLNENVALVIAMFSPFNADMSDSQGYSGSNLDTHLNTIWYSTLTNAAQSAIQSTNITQYQYSSSEEVYNKYTHASYADVSTKTTKAIVGDRYVFALSVDDVETYFNGTFSREDIKEAFWNSRTTIPVVTDFWLRSSVANDYIFAVETGGVIGGRPKEFGVNARPAFRIDLSQIDYAIL